MKIRNFLVAAAITLGSVTLFTSCGSMGGLNQSRLESALSKGMQAMTLSNAEVQAYVAQAVQQMDKQNKVAPANSKYTQRLNNLTQGLKSVNGTPLNFKVYETKEVNAFACADGSVRVYTGIMDLMDDGELLSVIGHEIGHVANEDSKNAMKNALASSALMDVVGSTNASIAALTDSQLGQIAQALMNSKYSRKEENNADIYGYNFLKNNNINPYYSVMAMEKLQSLENGNSAQMAGSLANAFSDHPQTSERIANLEKMCKKDGFSRPAAATQSSTSKSSTSKKK